MTSNGLKLRVRLAAQGNSRALRTLISRHSRIVQWKIRSIIGQSGNEADVEELANTTFYRMSRGLLRLKNSCCFRQWLITIAERVAYSYLRVLERHRRMGKLPHREAELSIEDLPQGQEQELLAATPKDSEVHEDAIIRRIDCQRAGRIMLDDRLLRQIRSGLPDSYWKVLWEAEGNDMKHEEIEERYGWSAIASRQKLHQALCSIKKLPLPVITVEIDERGRITARNWNGTPLNPDPFASI